MYGKWILPYKIKYMYNGARFFSFVFIVVGGLLWNQKISAQMAESSFNMPNKDEHISRSNIGIDLGTGDFRDFEKFDLGVRYLFKLNHYVCIDAIGLNLLSSGNSDDIWAQAMSGFRFYSSCFLDKMSLYCNIRGGLVISLSDGDSYNACFESGVGVNLTRKVSVGYVFNHHFIHQEDHLDYNALRIGFVF